MENEKTNSKIGLIIAIFVMLILIAGGVIYFIKNKPTKKEDDNTVVNKYTAYVKINPSVRLDYSQTCTKSEVGAYVCEEPVVDNYSLINEDAETIYEDVDLFSKGKTLDKVIEVICDKAKENNIDTQNIEITSDWKEINTYVEKSTKDEVEQRNYSVNVKPKEAIVEEIKTDEKQEAENKTTTTTTTKTTTKTTASNIIDLSSGVKYSHSMITYACEKCFSDSLINSLKNLKGTAFVSGNDSEITIKFITGLSDPYNSSTYKGTALTSKIKAAGGEEIGGAGGSDEPLTREECQEFHLKCK